MAWARFDDRFWCNEKILAAGDEAAGVYARAICYCSSEYTNGFVSDYMARFISGSEAVWNALLDSGLIIRVTKGQVKRVTGRRDTGKRSLPDARVRMPKDGYYIPDYLHFNPSKAEAESKRKHRQEAGSTPKQTESNSEAIAEQDARLPDPTRPEVKIKPPQTPPSRNGRLDAGHELEIQKLLGALRDRNGDTERRVRSYVHRYHLTEADLVAARDAARGPNVDSPAAVAVAELRKRGEQKGTQ